MSQLLRTSASPAAIARRSQLHFQGFHEFSSPNYPRVSRRFCSTDPNNFPVNCCRARWLCSVNSGGNVFSSPDAANYSPDHEEKDARPQGGKTKKSNEVLEKLRRYGLSGILSYGLLNTTYYLTTFLVVWFYVAPAPGRMGYLAAVERFVKVLAMVWAGSQVTKLVRAGGALALAPFVDRGLSWFTAKFNFESQGKAFTAIVGFCFGLAILMFFVVTLVSA